MHGISKPPTGSQEHLQFPVSPIVMLPPIFRKSSTHGVSCMGCIAINTQVLLPGLQLQSDGAGSCAPSCGMHFPDSGDPNPLIHLVATYAALHLVNMVAVISILSFFIPVTKFTCSFGFYSHVSPSGSRLYMMLINIYNIALQL